MIHAESNSSLNNLLVNITININVIIKYLNFYNLRRKQYFESGFVLFFQRSDP